MLDRWCTLLDGLEDTGCSNHSRINQVLLFGQEQRFLALSAAQTNLLNVCDVEVEGASGVEDHFEWWV